MTWTDALRSLNACEPAVEWASTQPDLATAWQQCQQGDQMLWLLGRLDRSRPWSEERRPLVACACACARTALPHTGALRGELEAKISAVEAWTRGEAGRRGVYVAHAAAYAAFGDNFAASFAANSTALAANVACMPHSGPKKAAACDACITNVASAAAAAATGRSCAGAHITALADCADIVRQHNPDPPRLEE